jgi:hypothetical protein
MRILSGCLKDIRVVGDTPAANDQALNEILNPHLFDLELNNGKMGKATLMRPRMQPV